MKLEKRLRIRLTQTQLKLLAAKILREGLQSPKNLQFWKNLEGPQKKFGKTTFFPLELPLFIYGPFPTEPQTPSGYVAYIL
jgi:hypothetical protein